MFGKLGEDEGRTTGPKPGDGAVLSGQAGAPDIEDTQPQELQDFRGRGRLAPGEPGADQAGSRTWLAALLATVGVLGGIGLVAAAVLTGR